MRIHFGMARFVASLHGGSHADADRGFESLDLPKDPSAFVGIKKVKYWQAACFPLLAYWAGVKRQWWGMGKIKQYPDRLCLPLRPSVVAELSDSCDAIELVSSALQLPKVRSNERLILMRIKAAYPSTVITGRAWRPQMKNPLSWLLPRRLSPAEIERLAQ